MVRFLRHIPITALLLTLFALTAHAQQQPITPAPIIPTATLTAFPVATINPSTQDARGDLCSAYQYPAFERYVVQAGDTLRDLLGGSDVISVTTAAALNCIDDPDALPIGSVIWLPAGVINGATAEANAGCTYAWLDGIDNAACPPEAARGLTGAVQPFEHGLLFWIREGDLIWLLTGSGRGQIFQNTFREGDPDPQAAAPDGLFVPVRGFGAIWQAMGGENSPLGWATAPETSAQIQQQAAGRISYTTYYRVNDYLLAITTTPPANNAAGQLFWVDLTP